MHKNVSIIHRSQKIGTTQISAVKWINKLWYNHLIEYYKAMKMNEVLLPASTWVILGMILNKEARYKSVHTAAFHVYEVHRHNYSMVINIHLWRVNIYREEATREISGVL